MIKAQNEVTCSCNDSRKNKFFPQLAAFAAFRFDFRQVVEAIRLNCINIPSSLAQKHVFITVFQLFFKLCNKNADFYLIYSKKI